MTYVDVYCSDCKIFLAMAKISMFKRFRTFKGRMPVNYMTDEGRCEYLCDECNKKRREKMK